MKRYDFDLCCNEQCPKRHECKRYTTYKQDRWLFNHVMKGPDDVVIDPTAGSCSSVIAAASMQRKAYGFEIKKQIYAQGVDNCKHWITPDLFEVSPQMEKRKKYIEQKLF